ncbi:Vld1p [Lachancea thermotolerans CBS 6340]|uniref:KLTH0F13640p n=1 Tax=Lachancea thermotolerans (strain ATCC 56472 / CBS 6340 / NRRL Y-8284) TaxID=559295 RepID=C5DJ55_LACTC|nr:KLTH0F13640p [Lachancea thermotolerans CBS 6340]CAR24344.1 KLTH0F13640p [Lachancea thermotolerans CBS 6340]
MNMRAAGQAEMLCYVLIYIRFIKDNSLANAVLSVLVVFISQFIQQMVILYEHRFRVGAEEVEHGEELSTIFKVLMRSIRYFQIAFLLQFFSSMGYHLTFDISEDVCSWKHGYIFTDVIGEFDCGRGGKLFVFGLDLVILLLELLAFDENFTKCVRSPDGTLQETHLDGYEFHRYGIFSILRFDSYNIEAHELKFTSDRHDVLQAERYGSTV